jgi:diacylglycerol O-acyltransferase / wax synthase
LWVQQEFDAMRQLSGLDASFLYIETPQTPMHVGSLTIYDKPAQSEDFAQDVRAHMAARLHLAPILHQRLELMPLDLGHPLWVDVADVDMDFHVQHQKLPKPGSRAQLEALVAKLHEGCMDRSYPLWQFFVIEGAKDGSLALYSKIHHAALDGAAGVMLANAMLDLGPTPRAVDAPAEKTIKPNSQAKLIGVMLSNTFAQYAKIVRALPDAVKQVASATMKGDLGQKVKAGFDFTKNGGLSQAIDATKELLAPKTPFNVSVGSARSFATLSLPFGEIKTVASACGASINDVVMALCSGALRRYLAQNKQLPKRSLLAAVPISLRAIDDKAQNNQVTMLPCVLGTDQKTCALRLKAAQAAMANVKISTSKFKSLIPTDYPSFGAPWLVGGLAQLYARTKLADKIALPVNLVISNVPGPKVPLYLAGARMRSYYPLSIVVHGLALNITVHSYADSLDIGIVACAAALPDLHPLAAALAAEHEELKVLAAGILLGSKATKAAIAKRSPKVASARTAVGKAPGVKQAVAKKVAGKPAARKLPAKAKG